MLSEKEERFDLSRNRKVLKAVVDQILNLHAIVWQIAVPGRIALKISGLVPLCTRYQTWTPGRGFKGEGFIVWETGSCVQSLLFPVNCWRLSKSYR